MRGEQQKAALPSRPGEEGKGGSDRFEWWFVRIIREKDVALSSHVNTQNTFIRIQSSTATATTLDLNFNAFLCNRPILSLVRSHRLNFFSILIFAISSPPPRIHFKCSKNIDMSWSPTSERSYFRLNKCFMEKYKV